MVKLLAGVFVGVFVGALVYEVIRKTEFPRAAARKVSDGLQTARKAFEEGYRTRARQPEGSVGLRAV